MLHAMNLCPANSPLVRALSENPLEVWRSPFAVFGKPYEIRVASGRARETKFGRPFSRGNAPLALGKRERARGCWAALVVRVAGFLIVFRRVVGFPIAYFRMGFNCMNTKG